MAVKVEQVIAKEIGGILVSHEFPDDSEAHFSGTIDFCWCIPTTWEILDENGWVVRTHTIHHWRQ